MNTNDTTIVRAICPEWCDQPHDATDHYGTLPGGIVLVQIEGNPIQAFLPGSDNPIDETIGLRDLFAGLAAASRFIREGHDA